MSYLNTRDDFQAAYKQFFRLVGELPPDLEQLRPLCANLDEYASRHPGCSWPLAVMAPEGSRTLLNNPDELLRLLSPEPTPVPATGRRGRPPRPANAEPLESEHSIRIAESTWKEIRFNVARLPKSEENPANIKKYLELAHKHYEAHLRKQGKLG
jgi:hypothetical protein